MYVYGTEVLVPGTCIRKKKDTIRWIIFTYTVAFLFSLLFVCEKEEMILEKGRYQFYQLKGPIILYSVQWHVVGFGFFSFLVSMSQ